MVLCPSPYNSFNNYKMVSVHLNSTLKFSAMHSFWKRAIQCRSPMLGESGSPQAHHVSQCSVSKLGFSPRSLVFLSDT